MSQTGAHNGYGNRYNHRLASAPLLRPSLVIHQDVIMKTWEMSNSIDGYVFVYFTAHHRDTLLCVNEISHEMFSVCVVCV